MPDDAAAGAGSTAASPVTAPPTATAAWDASPTATASVTRVDPAALDELATRLRSVVADLLATTGDLDRLDGLCVGAATVHDALGDLGLRWQHRTRALAAVSDDLAARVDWARSTYDSAETAATGAFGSLRAAAVPTGSTATTHLDTAADSP